MTGVDAQRQVQQNTTQVEQACADQIAQQASSGPRAGFQDPGQHELSCHHQKKRHGCPCQHPGKKEVGFRGYTGQGRSVDGCHQQGCRQAETVQSTGICFFIHDLLLYVHWVNTKPSTLLPDIR